MTSPTDSDSEYTLIDDPESGMQAVSMDDWGRLGFVPTLEAVEAAERREGKAYTGPRPAPVKDLATLANELAATQETLDVLLLADLGEF